jgi:hypothetical protein
VIAVTDELDATSLGGGGGIFDFPGRYYLSLALGQTFRPQQLRTGKAQRMFHLETDVRNTPPTVERLIVWSNGGVVKPADDLVLRTIGPAEWTRLSSREHAARDFWNWRRMFRCTRSVYVRTGAGDNGSLPQPPPAAKAKKKLKRKSE